LTLNALHFSDAKTGWAVGENGLIMKTVDGGTNWKTQASGITSHLMGIHQSANKIYATGAGGVILVQDLLGAPILIPRPKARLVLTPNGELRFHLSHSLPADLRIWSVEGRQVWRHRERLGAGAHTLSLPAHPGRGSLLEVRTGRETQVLRLHRE
jgi:hypothetical protein